MVCGQARISSNWGSQCSDSTRAGANFSGISGSDPNALRWDRLGYSTMMDLIEKESEEAEYLQKTQSIEYWDEMPSEDKIQSIAEYLRDVMVSSSTILREYTHADRNTPPSSL